MNIKTKCWVNLLRNVMELHGVPILYYTNEELALALEVAQRQLGEKAGYEALRVWLVANEAA